MPDLMRVPAIQIVFATVSRTQALHITASLLSKELTWHIASILSKAFGIEAWDVLRVSGEQIQYMPHNVDCKSRQEP